MAKTVLLVDDDPTQRRLMRAVCERAGYYVEQCADGQSAIDLIRSTKGQSVDVMMLDLGMPGLSGMETLEALRRFNLDLPVIVLTAQGSVDTVVKAMQAGANDFFVKPASPERVVVSIHNALNVKNLRGEMDRLKRKSDGAMGFKDLVGTSASLGRVMKTGERAAASNIPILITGESGVGKEMIARAIQGSSDRVGRPFITVNCGALPENLVESILFGHEKGAFTGATGKHMGKFQEADGGTIFLDEVGELPLEAQVKLLRVLQEGEVDPVGSKKTVKIDVRVVSATNRNLEEEVARGTFREDLFYRLNVFPIEVPPLRERREDIPDLIQHFINKYNAEENRDVQGVRHEVMDVLQVQEWPGNVRQLENAVFRAVVLCEGGWLSADDFPFLAEAFEQAGVHSGPPVAAADDHDSDDDSGHEGIGGAPFSLPNDISQYARPNADEDRVAVLDREGHLRTLYEIERDLIEMAIDKYDGQMSEVARRLGIGRSTLYRKVQEQGIEVKRAG
ncbi:sigma-54 dependent transcriptional regulator [Parvularcula sp. LCG005]|uniref:sigma-54-dependent transcriptional regulator n=1 Tax=Parvularcula sp. LCG005 TaxID=3078805 RepID=UPI0029427E6D|nr:sigma-54 dependent transcriptional regulator [Parvularcula sp. LCG005]WOI52319.1 sigma-54 dependent transcriptional regulator [Parvularcula sp. LCG005]